MNEYGRWLAQAIDRTWFRIAAWMLVIGIMGGQWYHARFMGFAERRAIDDPLRRRDGHAGHVQIDFGGQWLFGRMLVTGHGRELYQRSAYWDIAYRAFPRTSEAPGAKDHDAEGLVNCFMGYDAPELLPAVQASLTTLGSQSPVAVPVTSALAHDHLNPAALKLLESPSRPTNIGGPLYPPVHAFLMAPLALGDHPQQAYFVWQGVLMGLAVLTGLGVSYMTRGKIWWSAAILLILGFPGFRPSIDLGQNSALTLAILVWGWALNVRGRPILGGIVWGMLAYKPVWGLSFFVAAVALRQWRLCLSMAATGVTLVALTLPFVGVQSWKDWLHVGGEAAKLYDVDHNWVFLSRDLFGIPRRMLLDYDQPREARETLTAQVASWALWFFVFELTVRLWAIQRRGKQPPLVGTFPAFLFLAAWLCCYHFMYYDALIALFGIFVLFAHSPQRFFNPVRARLEVSSESDRPGGVILLNSVVLTLVGLLILHESIFSGLDIQATVSASYFVYEVEQPDGSMRAFAPTSYFATNVRYPWDTVLVLILWLWCGWLAMRDDDGLSSS